MSSQTLYRKYRPQTFADLIGQEHVAHTLLNELQKSQVAHAYLFSGPRGIGKTTTARLLAKAVNCQNPKNGEPDNICEACRSITEARALDVIEIDAASYTGVDNIREVIEHSRFTPSSLKFKVFIVDEVHMLSTAAFNALLKTLEEPPAHAMFILATTEIHKVPETIQSRCQKFDFHRINPEVIGKKLRWIAKQEDMSVDENVIEEIVRLADGSSRDAESILGQVFSLGEKKITLEQADLVLPRSNQAAVVQLILAILNNNRAEAIQNIDDQIENGIDLEAYRNDIIRSLRDCLLFRVVAPNIRPQIQNVLQEKLAAFTAGRIVKILENFLMIQQYISISPLPQVPLEIAIIESTSDQFEPAIQQTNPSTTVIEKKAEEPLQKKSNAGFPDPWLKIVEEVNNEAPMLAMSLKMVRSSGVIDDVLTITCPFTLHVERLSTPKAREVLDSVIKRVMGKKVTYKVELDPNLKLDKAEQKIENTNPADKLLSEKSKKLASGDQLWDQIVNAFEG
ncbi:MAG: DNA polymerase III subunit gamma/tau [Patescibacteria group bacterium]|jgi:DNA polymerase-3 subunit gamma/tau